jgi:type IV secretory pathway VirB6-like protein
MLLVVATTSCKQAKTESGHQVCIPAADTNQTDANGDPQEPLEKIEEFIKEKKIITTLVTDLKSRLIGSGGFSNAAAMYEGLATHPGLIQAMGAAFTLYVILYGLSVAAGLVQVTVGDAAIRISKVTFISIFAMNWGQFYGTVASFFVNGTEELMGYFMLAFKQLYFTGDVDTSSEFMYSATSSTAFIFNDLDIMVSRIFSPHTMALAQALLGKPENMTYAGFLAISFLYILMAIVTIVQVYVMSIFALSLLFALAPIFLIFMLFKQTNTMFDNWLNQIITYCIQPILVCAFVGMFIGLLAPTIQEFLQYKLCYGGTGSADEAESWCFIPISSTSTDCAATAASSEPPIGVQKVLLFFVFSWLFGANVRFAADLAGSISPSFAADMTKQGAMWKQIQDGRVGGAAAGPINTILGR